MERTAAEVSTAEPTGNTCVNRGNPTGGKSAEGYALYNCQWPSPTGQYSTEGISGQMAFKRRYTGGSTDSFALVTVTGGATYTGISNGTHRDAVTGDVKTVSTGTLSVGAPGKANLRVYVLNGPGKIGGDGPYLK